MILSKIGLLKKLRLIHIFMLVNLHLIQHYYLLDPIQDLYLVMMFRITTNKYLDNKFIRIRYVT